MSISDKIIQLNQVKQDIKQAIEMKGIPMTNVAFTEYANKIADISGGGGGGGDFPTISYDEIEYFGWSYYMFSRSNVIEQIPQAWQDMKDSETVLFDIPLTLVAPNQEMGGVNVDLYVGTNGQLQALYDACANGTIPPPISNDNRDVYYVNNVATFYAGDASGQVGFPIPLYNFGNFGSDDTSFLVGDLTPLSMGLGIVLAKITSVTIPNNKLTIQQGFEFEEPYGIILPNSVTSISYGAFDSWTSNNQPLVIPNSVTSIGDWSFGYWTSNNQPLVIPNSVTSIGNYAFRSWEVNNQPLVIPNSVTSIGNYAFYDWTNVPYVEMKRETPPTLESSTAFGNQNNAPIYVPHNSVNAYKNATNWSALASRIFSINDK
jgi:hypothetical protein